MTPIRKVLADQKGVDFLITGVGLTETVLSLSRRLLNAEEIVKGVVNLGVAGAYVDTGVKVLDVCLASCEIIGDLGVCNGDQVAHFADGNIKPPVSFSLLNPLHEHAISILNKNKISYHSGIFVTVNAVSGNKSRGIYLRDQYQAICENMEGAAVARVCAACGIDCLEMRSVSNLVEDRDPSRWKLADAIDICAHAASQLVPTLCDTIL